MDSLGEEFVRARLTGLRPSVLKDIKAALARTHKDFGHTLLRALSQAAIQRFRDETLQPGGVLVTT